MPELFRVLGPQEQHSDRPRTKGVLYEKKILKQGYGRAENTGHPVTLRFMYNVIIHRKHANSDDEKSPYFYKNFDGLLEFWICLIKATQISRARDYRESSD